MWSFGVGRRNLWKITFLGIGLYVVADSCRVCPGLGRRDRSSSLERGIVYNGGCYVPYASFWQAGLWWSADITTWRSLGGNLKRRLLAYVIVGIGCDAFDDVCALEVQAWAIHCSTLRCFWTYVREFQVFNYVVLVLTTGIDDRYGMCCMFRVGCYVVEATVIFMVPNVVCLHWRNGDFRT